MIRITARLALPKDQAIGTSSGAIRRYAAPAKAASGGKKKETVSRGSRGLDAADSRSDVIKKVSSRLVLGAVSAATPKAEHC